MSPIAIAREVADRGELQHRGDICFPQGEDAPSRVLMYVCPCGCGTHGSVKFKGPLSDPSAELRTVTVSADGVSMAEPLVLRCGSYTLSEGVWNG